MKTNNDLSWLHAVPIAHRAMHDASKGRIENSLSAVKTAIEAGLAIEVDLQLSSDRVPIVFHDATLGRLTGETGSLRKRTAAELKRIRLGDTEDHIPGLDELLKLVDGKSTVILELKSIQGFDEGFVKAVLEELKSYKGPVALMTFGHKLLEDARKLKCQFPLGLVAEGDDSHDEKHQRAVRRFDIDFISYNINDLPNRFVASLREQGMPIICWTVRDKETMQKAALYTDQFTFEGFDPVAVHPAR